MHQKLRLNVDELTVESFVPSTELQIRGTVRGAQETVNVCTYDGPGCDNITNAPSFCASPESCDWTHCVNLSCVINCTANTCPTNTTDDPMHTLQAETCAAKLCPTATE